MKFGVEIPGTVEEAISFDEKNGNTIWKDSVEKEMKNSCITFKLLQRHGKLPVGYTEVNFHLVFCFKLDMTIKYWYVAGSDLTYVPRHMTYSSAMFRYTVRIRFLVAAMNVLNIFSGDIHNAFLEAPAQEKVFFYVED